MILYQPALTAILSLLSLSFPTLTTSHGYIKSPRSRNFVAHEDGVWWPVVATNPQPESEPQSANIGGVDAVCGIIAGQRNYDYPKNAEGGALDPNPQACWRPGQVVDLSVVLTAHHKGHFEFKACPIAPGGVATQACFDANPLTFVSESSGQASPDPNYPIRFYIPDTDWNLSFKYQLPPGLRGELVLLQWYYVTANSCSAPGYDGYDFPQGWKPTAAECPAGSIPPDGRGVPEQFWNCAEVRILAECDGPPVTTTEAPPATTTTEAATTTITTNGPGTTTEAPPATTTTTEVTTTEVTTTQATNTPNPNCQAKSSQCGPSTTCASIGFPGLCCSEWGYCGSSIDHCGGDCCQSGPCLNGPPAPTPPTGNPPTGNPPTGNPPTGNPPTTGSNYSADHGEDSRLIAYVGNWQACPTAEQVDAYSHLVIAFAVSYTYSSPKNNCDTQCNIASSVPICNNMNNQALVDTWRDAGKKVILSFGGAGMGGSWSGDQNNCWDYCFGKEEALSTSLVNIIDSQKFDGIDIDYEYCYDVAGKQSGRCGQRSSAYTDAKAQTFLDQMTSKLRTKLDALQANNGYNRGRYEVTHAPMDSDMTPSSSAYFQILHNRRADLDFLMPQFYNGVTRPALGVDGSGGGQMSAAALFGSLSNELFDSEPNKVVFGHCISNCGGTGSNINAAQAVQVTSDLKNYNNGEFACNGGAFLWVAADDVGGAWSNAVLAEVSETAGCSDFGGPSTTSTTSTVTTTTEEPTKPATTTTTTATTTEEPTKPATTTTTTTTTEEPTKPATTTTTVTTTEEPTKPATTTTTTATTTEEPTKPATTTTTATTTEEPTKPATTTTTATTTEEPTKPATTTTTATTTEEPTKPATTTTTTTPATTTTTTTTSSRSGELVLDQTPRCGTSEIDAREHCKNTCAHNGDCAYGEYCWGVHANYCGSISERTYINPVQSSVWNRCGKKGPETEIHARTFCGEPCTWQCSDPEESCVGIHSNYCGSDFTSDDGPVTTTDAPPATTTQAPPATTTTSGSGELVINNQARCGSSELDARESCGNTCAHNGDCPSGKWCWGVHPNYCGSIPQRTYTNPVQGSWTRCGKTEIDARTFCGEPCTWQCSNPEESCQSLNSNYCGSNYTD